MKCVTYSALIILTAMAGLAQSLPFATGQSARLVIGQPEFDAESDTASQTIVGAVSGLAYANGSLFVADSNLVGAAPVNNRVLIYNGLNTQLPAPNKALPYNSLCPVCVGEASLVLGQSDWVSVLPAPCVPPPSTVTPTTTPTTPACTTTDYQTPIATGMRVPTAVATDGTHLAVADTLNNRVLIWNTIPAAMNQAPDVVVGQTSFTTAGFPATPTASSLRLPQGVWIQNGMLFIADTQNNRILIYNSIPTANGAAADLVLGQPNFTTWVQVNIADQTTNAAANNMLDPVSVTSDGQHLFVADLGYNRVLIWNTMPTSNQQPADVEIGQPDMTTGISDDSYSCAENGTAVHAARRRPATTSSRKWPPCAPFQTAWTPTITQRTLPCVRRRSVCRVTRCPTARACISQTRGNDRVLIYNTIPTADGAPADIVLGQTDFESDAPTDGADTLDAPSSMAWDGANLYVADTYNQRILVYTPAEQDLAYNAVLNAASLVIYATDTVTIGGTIKSGDKVTVTIGVLTSATTVPYTYTIQSGDDFAGIVDGLVALINGGKDPNVLATADTQADEVVLTAKVPGVLGNNVTVVTSISSGAEITAVASSANLAGGGSAASIAPGSLVSFLAAPGATLSDQTASAPANGPLPLTLGGVQVYFNGVQSPLLFVSPKQINAQLPFNFQYAGSGTANAWVRIQRNDGTIVATDTVAISIVAADPGIFAAACSPTPCLQPALAYHSSNYATGVISVDGTIRAGNIGSICIGSTSALTATTTVPTGCNGRLYNYTVQASDSLATIQQAFVGILNQDPQLTATASSEFTRILLQARTPGTAGNGILFEAIVNTGADLLLTPIGPAPPSPSAGAMLCCANTAGTPLTNANPAKPGETIVVYATGLGVPESGSGPESVYAVGPGLSGSGFQYPAGGTICLGPGR